MHLVFYLYVYIFISNVYTHIHISHALFATDGRRPAVANHRARFNGGKHRYIYICVCVYLFTYVYVFISNVYTHIHISHALFATDGRRPAFANHRARFNGGKHIDIDI